MGALPTYNGVEPQPLVGKALERKRLHFVFVLCMLLACLSYLDLGSLWSSSRAVSTTPDFSHLATVCADVPSIPLAEFSSRRDALVPILQDTSFDSLDPSQVTYRLPIYLSEPSANTLYYFNITPSHWHLSERPFLPLILPTFGRKEKSQVVVLSPSFEVSRARGLPWALDKNEDISFVSYLDEQDPYKNLFDWLKGVATEQAGDKDVEIAIQADENVRNFVVDGLKRWSAKYSSDKFKVSIIFVNQRVREQRMRKTPVELDLLRCAEKVTRLAVQEVRKYLYVGMTELEAESLIVSALKAAGLSSQDAIVLFGQNAALPHASAGNKVLEEGEFVLLDVGGPLRGYNADLTRTVLPASVPYGKWPSPTHEKVWKLVQQAQQAAVKSLETKGVNAAQVDGAARGVIKERGLGEYFTHRVGHGIGLEVHEAPYLTAANTDLVLLPGETFSDEPGIYIEGTIGVRLEDTILKTEEGYEILSGGFALSPWEP